MGLGMRPAAALALLLAATATPSAPPAGPEAGPEAIVLGIAQDGGIPHLGCLQALCVEARRDPTKRRMVAALGLVDAAAGRRFLIDATPDLPAQVELLGGLPDAILLTHAHIGHYLGLAQLGREVVNAKNLPVYCTASMARFLRANKPWSRLVERGNVAIREIEAGKEFRLTEHLRVTAIRVPHRDEDSDTVAYLVRGPRRRVLWLPDIDCWEKWDRDLSDFAADADLTMFLDGTFFSADEIPGRAIEDIPHPLVPDTMDLLSRRGTPPASVRFVHLNHTNRLSWDAGALRRLEARGFGVARQGEKLSL
ncbi:MAG TPA: MBL fold metallo-hydrolase [Thermoanaerobaculia bacterium]|nr:MBL fold metallo-hydrolase [Thermoanaerobaculia bacterium]